MLEVVESFVEGKYATRERCEDGIVSTPHHIALIDGATTEPGHEINGRAPGRFAMETVAAAIRTLNPEADAVSTMHKLSRALAEALARHRAPPAMLASATVLIAAGRQRQVWRVGNSTFMVNGQTHEQHWNLVEIPARMRSAYLRALLRAGTATPEELTKHDPGQELIAPLLRLEHVFRNASDAGELAYAAIDGSEIPASLIEQVEFPPGASVVFASDGYPLIRPTLRETETYLQQSLAEDPLRIYRHPEVRGLGTGQASYDDRAYVRFRATR